MKQLVAQGLEAIGVQVAAADLEDRPPDAGRDVVTLYITLYIGPYVQARRVRQFGAEWGSIHAMNREISPPRLD
jgi:hypothetical protein